MRYLVLASMAAALAGCGPIMWNKQGTSQAQFDQDNARCKLVAQGMNAHEFYAQGKPAYVAGATLGDAVGTAISTRATYKDCMIAAGYTEAQPQTVQAQPPGPTVTPVAYAAPSAAPKDGRWISKDGLIELKLSDEWRPNNTPTTATNVQLRVLDSQGTGLALADRDGRDIVDLRAFSDAAETRMVATMTNTQTWPAESTTINGHAAVQFEYAGVFRGERGHCLVTVIQTENRVSILTGCTPESKFASERDKIMAAATGLRETTR